MSSIEFNILPGEYPKNPLSSLPKKIRIIVFCGTPAIHSTSYGFMLDNISSFKDKVFGKTFE